MHCSANIGPKGDSAIFFGLSGTGKTTLSADPNRALIGDDEHGWDDKGVFNFEGGCYAKIIRLSKEAEPEIYATTRRFGTILENVAIDTHTRRIDLDDDSFTENTRASYPMTHIPNIVRYRQWRPSDQHHLADLRRLRGAAADLPPDPGAGHVPLPLRLHRQGGRHRGRGHRAVGDLLDLLRRPVHGAESHGLRGTARRKDRQAQRHLLAGQHRLERRPYGVGSRMKIGYSRALVNAALDGTLNAGEFEKDSVFGLSIPTLPRGAAEVLNPRNAWADKAEYDETAAKLVGMFKENFAKYAPDVSADVANVM